MKFYFILIAIVLFPLSLFSQEADWGVPDDKAKQLSSFKFTSERVEAGKDLFNTNCASCHGQPGAENFINLVPPPGDPAGEKFQRNTDGEIHFKVTNGRGAMPSFKNILSSSDIWNIIAYLRTFNPDYTQKVAEKLKEGTFGASDLKILLAYFEEAKTIEAKVTGMKEGEQIPVANAQIDLFAKRQFGNLPIDESKRTNEEGVSVFKAPDDLPGDTAGYIGFIAKLPNEDVYGTVVTDTLILAGVPIHPVSARAERAMWNTFRMAPVWLLITYFAGVLLAWSFILYIVFQIYNIIQAGKNEE